MKYSHGGHHENNMQKPALYSKTRVTLIFNRYLTDNPLNCDCGIVSFYEWAIARPSVVSTAKCSDGTQIINLEQSNFTECSKYSMQRKSMMDKKFSNLI